MMMWHRTDEASDDDDDDDDGRIGVVMDIMFRWSYE
jgi:hypothetical protein